MKKVRVQLGKQKQLFNLVTHVYVTIVLMFPAITVICQMAQVLFIQSPKMNVHLVTLINGVHIGMWTYFQNFSTHRLPIFSVIKISSHYFVK